MEHHHFIANGKPSITRGWVYHTINPIRSSLNHWLVGYHYRTAADRVRNDSRGLVTYAGSPCPGPSVLGSHKRFWLVEALNQGGFPVKNGDFNQSEWFSYEKWWFYQSKYVFSVKNGGFTNQKIFFLWKMVVLPCFTNQNGAVSQGWTNQNGDLVGGLEHLDYFP